MQSPVQAQEDPRPRPQPICYFPVRTIGFHIVKVFWFCPECFIIERWEKYSERRTAVRGAGAAALSPRCCCNPLVHFNPIMSPCGCFQFWPLKK